MCAWTLGRLVSGCDPTLCECVRVFLCVCVSCNVMGRVSWCSSSVIAHRLALVPFLQRTPRDQRLHPVKDVS